MCNKQLNFSSDLSIKPYVREIWRMDGFTDGWRMFLTVFRSRMNHFSPLSDRNKLRLHVCSRRRRRIRHSRVTAEVTGTELEEKLQTNQKLFQLHTKQELVVLIHCEYFSHEIPQGHLHQPPPTDPHSPRLSTLKVIYLIRCTIIYHFIGLTWTRQQQQQQRPHDASWEKRNFEPD